MRYRRYSHAAVALEDTLPLAKSASADIPTETLWATNALKTPKGTCVALKKRGDRFLVGVRTPALTWLPVEQVLTRTEVLAWAKRAQFT